VALSTGVSAPAALHAAPPSARVDLRTDVAGLDLEHPVLNGSGTFDAIAALRAFGDALRERFPFSAFVSKTITLKPRAGNPPPRLWESPAGLINSIGLPNKGLDGFLAEDLPALATLPVPLVVSVAGFSTDEFETLVQTVAARPEVAALELNVSCPNVKSGCVVGSEAAEMTALMRRVRPLTRKPLIVKLTPNVADIGPVARAAEAEGADALSLINTLRAVAVDPVTGRPWLGAGSGGLSGPAVRPVALALTAAVAGATGLPVVGMGGIQDGCHALEFIAQGATCVAVGTETFRDPQAATRVRAELARELQRRSWGSVHDARAPSRGASGAS
jgi:dihydroorotate dehydrogenase (NAD+) catalytic subunit